jgi:hypothetical protein
MPRLNQKITINGLELPFVQTVAIKDSRNDFTNTAEINIQNRINEQGNKISDLILKGSEVVIQLGYFPKLFEEFRGYVSQVIPDKTAVILCENESYNYKRQSIGKDIVQKKTTLKKLINAIYTGPAEIADANIGDWKISKTSTLIDVLSELQNKFKLYCYFRGKTLIVGAQADTTVKNTIPAHFQKNVPIGESSFNFKQAEADKIVVKATNIKRDGSINEIYAYYDGSPLAIVFSKVAPTSGSVNEFNIGGQSALTDADLKELAKIRLEALSFTGCDGSITIYGYPSAKQGDICEVTDLDISEKNGNYAIVEVIKRFGVGIGYRQDLGLGIQQ